MVIQTWADVLVSSFQNLWGGVVGFLPSLIGAIIVFVLGLFIASGLASLVERLAVAVKLDQALASLSPMLERAGLKLNAGKFFGQLVFWFMFVVFLLAASDILKLFALSEFLRDVVGYIPNIIIAVLIMVAAFMLGNLLRNVIRASAQSAKVESGKFLGTLAWWAVIVFGFLATLVQLGIAVALINTLITGLVAMLALAGGIAFGLGGRDYAAHLIEQFREEVEHGKR